MPVQPAWPGPQRQKKGRHADRKRRQRHLGRVEGKIEPDHGDNLAGIRDGTGMISLLDAGRRAVVEQGDGQ